MNTPVHAHHFFCIIHVTRLLRISYSCMRTEQNADNNYAKLLIATMNTTAVAYHAMGIDKPALFRRLERHSWMEGARPPRNQSLVSRAVRTHFKELFIDTTRNNTWTSSTTTLSMRLEELPNYMQVKLT